MGILRNDDAGHNGPELDWLWPRLRAALDDHADAVTEAKAVLADPRATAARRQAAAGRLALALSALEGVEGECADQFVTMLRCAVRHRFGDAFGLAMEFATIADWREQCRRFLSARPGGTSHAVALEHRVAELETAVAHLEAHGAGVTA